MSFSSEIKKELCSVKDMSGGEMAAMLYGMFFAGRTADGRPVIQTENADLIAAARSLSEEIFPETKHGTTRLVRSGGSLYTFSVKSGAELIAERFGDISEINTAVVSGNDEESGAFLRGVFVSCGSVTDPNKEYHIELVLPDRCRAEQLYSFIREHGMAFKLTRRRGSAVLYAKESELIEDFLTYIGAGLRSLEIMQIKIEKDLRNRANRTVNCDSANLDKTVAASGKCCRDIELIINTIGADKLSPDLRETALIRLNNRESSLGELCRMFEKPISRSGLNHRLKKLSAIADEIRHGGQK